MISCFGPSKSTRLKSELEQLRQTLRNKECEIVRLKQQEAAAKQKDAQQTEALQSAAAHVAQLEGRLQQEKYERAEQQKLNEQKRQQLEEDYSQQLAELRRQADLQRQQLESQLRDVQQRFAQHQDSASQQRQQLETQINDEQKKLEEYRSLAEQQRQELEARLADETQRYMEQQRIAEHQGRLYAQTQRRLAAEEQRSLRLQKQISSFTETMEEVSKVLIAVEHDSKSTVSSPVMVERRSRPSVADQLRQSLALYKRVKEDEVQTDQGKAGVPGTLQYA